MRQTRILDTPASLGLAVASEIAALLAAAPGTFLLGCPGGRSPKPVYAALSRIAARDGMDLSQLVLVMMDDYLTDNGGGLTHVDASAHYSCRRFASDEIQAVLNAGLPPSHRIPDQNVWFPDPKAPADYDTRISAAGGVDYFLLASGASDGHVAFNPVGSAANSVSRIVPLSDDTRRDNLLTFPEFAGLDQVPRHGVTVGIATIAASRRVGMVVWGSGKQLAFQRLSAAEGYDPAWPATVWAACPHATLYADQAAAKGAD